MLPPQPSTTPQEVRDFLRKPNKRSAPVSEVYEMEELPRRSKRIRAQRTPDTTLPQSSINPPQPSEFPRRSKRAKVNSSKSDPEASPPQASKETRKPTTLPGWIFSQRYRDEPPLQSSTNLPAPSGAQETRSMPPPSVPELSQRGPKKLPPQSSRNPREHYCTPELCNIPTALDPQLSQRRSEMPPPQRPYNPSEPCSSSRRPIKPLRRRTKEIAKSTGRTYQTELLPPNVKYMRPLPAEPRGRKRRLRWIRDFRDWLFDDIPVADFREEAVFLEDDDEGEHPMETWASRQLRKTHRVGRGEMEDTESAMPGEVEDEGGEGDQGDQEVDEGFPPTWEGVESGQVQWPEGGRMVQLSEGAERTLSQTKWEDIQYGQEKWPETGRSKR